MENVAVMATLFFYFMIVFLKQQVFARRENVFVYGTTLNPNFRRVSSKGKHPKNIGEETLTSTNKMW